MGLTGEDIPPEAKEGEPEIAIQTEHVTSIEQAERLLELWRGADHVTVLPSGDLSVIDVFCQTGPDTGIMAELAKDSYAGDWSELLTLFQNDSGVMSFVVVCPMRVEINLTFVCSVTS